MDVEIQDSLDEQTQQLRTQFDEHVSQTFCATAEEVQEYLALAHGDSNRIIAAFKTVGAFLEKEGSKGHKWQEDEICHSLIPAALAPVTNEVVQETVTKDRHRASGMSQEEIITQLQSEWHSRVGSNISTEEVEEVLKLTRAVSLILQGFSCTAEYVKSRTVITPTHAREIEVCKTKISGLIRDARAHHKARKNQ
jgi:hypothetical protein